MTTLAERAKTAHARGMKAARRETVTFYRGSKSCSITNAIRAEQTDDIVGPDGNLIVQHASIDWLLPQSEVLIDSEAVEPRERDRIVPADTKSYEAMKPNPNVPAVVPHTGTQFWLVHTKLIRD